MRLLTLDLPGSGHGQLPARPCYALHTFGRGAVVLALAACTFACGGLVDRDREPGGTPEALPTAGEPPPSRVPEGPSCAAMNGDECNGESCCANILVPSGTFPRGRCETAGCSDYWCDDCNSFETPEHPATLGHFYLDKYEVTVGRFRAFVEATGASPPAARAGAHPRVDGTGWDSAWDAELPADPATLESVLRCEPEFATWTEQPGAQETLPMNCVNWYYAFAFCAWDGGRLPTEAEWECAAAGGEENRLYPWGSSPPDDTRACDTCECDGSAPGDCLPGDILPVGSKPAGSGRWGHVDLAGSLWEWVLDWYHPDAYREAEREGCVDCVQVAPEPQREWRVHRGGDWRHDSGPFLRATYRYGWPPATRNEIIGIRCARSAD